MKRRGFIASLLAIPSAVVSGAAFVSMPRRDEPFSIVRHQKKLLALLPRGVELYAVGGQVMFPFYGCSGGLAAAFLMYAYKGKPAQFDGYDLGTLPELVKSRGGAYHPVVIHATDSYRQACAKFSNACRAVQDA